MNFSNYQIPKDYIDKFKVTKRDKRQFKKFWDDELLALNRMTDLSKKDIKLIHKSFMDCFWTAKAIAKEKYTPAKYKNNIYINHN